MGALPHLLYSLNIKEAQNCFPEKEKRKKSKVLLINSDATERYITRKYLAEIYCVNKYYGNTFT